MLKNVQDAKFAKTLVPISKVVLATADQRSIAFDAFFSQIVVHEMMHGLGPHNITVNGRETTVRKEMKEASSFLDIDFVNQVVMGRGAIAVGASRSSRAIHIAGRVHDQASDRRRRSAGAETRQLGYDRRRAAVLQPLHEWVRP